MITRKPKYWGVKNFIKRNFKSFVYFFKKLKHRVFINMLLSIGVGILDGFGLAMFLPLLQMIDDSTSVNPEGLGNLQFLVNSFNEFGFPITLFSVLAVMVVFFTLKGFFQYGSSLYTVILRQYFVRKLRIKLSLALSSIAYKNFIKSDAGRIQNTLSGEVSRISQAYQNYFGAFQQIVLVIVYMSFAFIINAEFAFLICLGGALTNLVYKRIYKVTKISSKQVTIGRNKYQGLILQFVSNYKYLKATGFIKKYNEKLINSILFIEEQNLKIGKLASVVTALREPLLIIVVSVVILIQINYLDGSLGTILLSLLFFYRALSSLILMQTYYNHFLEVSGSMDNMTNFEMELDLAKEKFGKIKVDSFKDEIHLDNVGFYYEEQMILQNLNFKIKKYETIAFVGESGSGKTTLINIISGLLPAGYGKIMVDGIDYQEINLPVFQQRIGYITQDPVIFNDTVYNNVTFWKERNEHNIKRFHWALKQASIDVFINDLPAKEETILGHNGINLSGGQKQRISIARELFKDVDILVLDEATSALDSETEENIQRGLDLLHGKYTMLVVAHRLSTIKNADRIIIMNQGNIVEEGNFANLLLNSSKFQKMVELQEV